MPLRYSEYTHPITYGDLMVGISSLLIRKHELHCVAPPLFCFRSEIGISNKPPKQAAALGSRSSVKRTLKKENVSSDFAAPGHSSIIVN